MAVLGALLYDAAAFLNVDGVVTPEDFYEPFHGRLFKAIANTVRVGRIPEPILMRDYFTVDPAFHDLGGIRYLADLVDRAPPSANAKDYAMAVRSIAQRREVIRICDETRQLALEDGAMDGGDLMAGLERQMLATRRGGNDLTLREWRDVSSEIVYGMDRPDDRPLVKLGLEKIDNALGGVERGELVILGARPSMGKSALAGCIAWNVAQQGLGVCELNGEMTTQQMGRRHISDAAFASFGEVAPTYRDIRRKVLTDEQKRMIYQIDQENAHLPLRMLKRTGMTLGRTRALLRRQKMLWEAAGIPLTLVVVDHVGLISPDEEQRGIVENQTLISGGLKAMAEELDVVMLGLAQLNREVEKRDDKRPQLSDLRSSGSWEQDADVVIGVYRDAYYARRETEPKSDVKVAEWLRRQGDPTIEAIMLKVREGDVAIAKLWSNIGHNAIRDYAPAEDRDDAFSAPQQTRIDFSGGYKPHS